MINIRLQRESRMKNTYRKICQTNIEDKTRTVGMLLYEFFLRWVVLTLQLNLLFDIVLNIWQSWKLIFLMLQVNCHFHWQPTTIQKLWRKHSECSWYPVTTLIAKLCLTTKEFDGKKANIPRKMNVFNSYCQLVNT